MQTKYKIVIGIAIGVLFISTLYVVLKNVKVTEKDQYKIHQYEASENVVVNDTFLEILPTISIKDVNVDTIEEVTLVNISMGMTNGVYLLSADESTIENIILLRKLEYIKLYTNIKGNVIIEKVEG